MFKSLGNLLGNKQFGNKSAKSSTAQELFNFLELVEKWPEIVGPRMSQHTVPLKNDRRILTILTNHSAFSQQLGFMEEVLKKKIFETFPDMEGKIKGIKFQTNSSHFDQKMKQKKIVEKKKEVVKQTTLHPYSPQYKKLKAEAESLLSDMSDAEAKESLVSLYVQMKHRD
jgi:hypothetical protein